MLTISWVSPVLMGRLPAGFVSVTSVCLSLPLLESESLLVSWFLVRSVEFPSWG